MGLILVKVVIDTDFIYMRTKKIYSDRSDVCDFYLNIERFANEDGVRGIEVDKDKLIIYKGNSAKNFEKQEIFRDGDKVLIKYYDIRNFEDYNTRNTLALNVDDFKIKEKGKLVYICIEKGGNEYIKCL